MQKNKVKNAKKKSFVEQIFYGFIFALPVVLIFSYYPVISLGANETMNFELSLPLIWLVLFDILVLILFFKYKLWKNVFKKWAWVLFPIFASLSLFWSLNLVRGVLTVGILWLIYLAVFGLFELKNVFMSEGFWWKWRKVFYGSSLFVCGFCLLQCILDLASCGQSATLMCDGCTYKMFGFPHPNGFAIEPQFMGNLLLAPAILSGVELYNSLFRDEVRCFAACPSDTLRAALAKSSRSQAHTAKHRTLSVYLGRILLFVVFTATLFLTFSRGAIYAFILAMIVFTIWEIVRSKKWRVMVLWPVIILSFLFTLNLQGIFAQVSKTDDTYLTGVVKVINQLSLGVIEIPVQVENVSTEVGAEDIVEIATEETDVIDEIKNTEDEAVFDGYVEESTDTRVRLSDAGLRIWSQDFKTMMFGVGIGGAGQALYQNGLSPAPKEIVQNEYVSLLLEVGIIGVGLVILTVVLSILALKKSENMMVILIIAISYGATLLFFSGFPNVLHIYLIISLLPIILPKYCMRNKL